jgi:S1-C subfamily serine protease
MSKSDGSNNETPTPSRTNWALVGLAASLSAVICGIFFISRMPSIKTEDSPSVSRPAQEQTLSPQTSISPVPPGPIETVIPPRPPPPTEESASELFKRLAPAVVRIACHNSEGKPGRQGSGFFLTDDGLVATNYHVIAEADAVEVFLNTNARFPLQGVVAISRDEDLALLKVQAVDVPVLQVQEGELLEVGSTVYTIGNPRGLVNSFSRGEVSGLRTRADNLKLIQCTAPMSPGSSGGPLLNKSGKVIGVTTSHLLESQNLNFAVPISQVRRLMELGGKAAPLGEALGRPKPKPWWEDLDAPRWLKDLPYEARISFSISADEHIKGLLEGYFKRELRRISNVVMTDEKPEWEFSVVALPHRFDNQIVGYWMSVVIFEISEHWDPKKPDMTSTKGQIVKHQLIMRGVQVLEEGVKEAVVSFEGEVVERSRQSYERMREVARKWKEKQN